MSTISKHFHRVRASLEAEALEAIREDIAHGDLSAESLAIEDAREARRERLTHLALEMYQARNDEADAREFRTVEAETRMVRSAMEAVNDAGGFTHESYGFARLAMQAPLRRVGVQPPMVRPSTESVEADAKFQMSLEDIDQLIDQIAATKDDVEKKSVDGILRILATLQELVPETKDRLRALCDAVRDLTYDETKDIRLDVEIVKALAVDGKLPTGFKDFLTGYTLNANRILGAFNENAQVAAGKAASLGETIGTIGDNACPITALTNALKDIGDPRDGIEPDALMYCLPGSGPLFGNVTTDDAVAEDDAMADETDTEVSVVDQASPTTATESLDDGGDPAMEEVRSRIQKFCDNFAPLDPLGWTDRDFDGEQPTIRVLSKETITAGLGELTKVLEMVDIKTYGEAHRQTWISARSAFSNYQAGKNRLTAVQAAALRPLDDEVCEYLDVVYELAAWPALHLLVNAVFTAHAFLLLCERSIAGQSADEPEPMPEVPADDMTDTSEVPPAEDVPADTGVPVDGTADAGGEEVPTGDEGAPDANGDVPPETGGDGTTPDADAAIAADENNDALKGPQETEEEEDEDAGLGGAAI